MPQVPCTFARTSPGTPLYKCGNCSTVLRAKHATTDGQGIRRGSDRGLRESRAASAFHADNIDSRKLPAKPLLPESTQKQASLDAQSIPRSMHENHRPILVDPGAKSPSHVDHRSYPPGPTPPSDVVKDDVEYNGHGIGNRRPPPPDFLARHESKEDLSDRRKGPAILAVNRITSPTHVEDVVVGKKSPNHAFQNKSSPPAGLGIAMNERRGLANLRTRNRPTSLTPQAPQNSPPADLIAVATRRNSSPANLAVEAAKISQREREENPEDEDEDEDEDDLTTFSPTKALAARRNAGPLYKAERPRIAPTSNFLLRSSRGGLYKGRNLSQGVEVLGSENTDSTEEQRLDGLQHGAGEAGPSTSRLQEHKPGLQRPQRSEGLIANENVLKTDPDNVHPGHHAAMRRSSEDLLRAPEKSPEGSPRLHPVAQDERSPSQVGEVIMEKQKKDPEVAQSEEVIETQGKRFTSGVSSLNLDMQQTEAGNGSSPIPAEQVLSPAGDVSLGRWRQPDLKEPQEEVVVNTCTSDDEQDRSPIKSPRAGRKPLSPPRSIALSPPSSFHLSPKSFGRVQPHPEHLSKAQAGSRQDMDASTTPQDMYGQPDVLDYDTSDDSSNMDDADPYQGTSMPQSEDLKSSLFDNKEQEGHQNETGEKSEPLGDEHEEQITDKRHSKSSSGEQLQETVPFGPTTSGCSPRLSPHRSPESNHSASSSEDQIANRTTRRGTFVPESDAPESSNNFSFGQGGEVQASDYSLLKGQTQIHRLKINTPIPERIHVRCRHCKLHLEVPLNLPRSQTGVQKLRCGSCWKVSRFRLNHLLSPNGTSSPGASEGSPESSFRLGPNSPEDSSNRYSGTRSNRETGFQDRVILRTQSGANLPLPPSARHNPRAVSGSKLAQMSTATSIPSETSEVSTPNTSGDLGPAGSSIQGGRESVDISPLGEAEPSNASHSPTLSFTSQDAGTNRPQRASPDRKILQSSSDSDEEKASAQIKLGPSALPARMTAWSGADHPEFDDGHEFKGIKGFLKKSVKEFTKGKKSNQFRRKVIVNGHAVPDDLVKRAEEYAGPIHPGSYWYDNRAGFWGVMGGHCLGMIPPFIEELAYPLARHCSQGKTGVLVNGRELHHKDLELLKRRGLPGTPGKAYNVDIDGRLMEDATGHELKGLGRLAPTLEQTGRGPGMWVPESQRGS